MRAHLPAHPGARYLLGATTRPGVHLPTRTQPVSVLVVDDDVAIREMLVEYLATRGYRVEGTADGRLALELLRTGDYQCVLTDFQVPHADGLAIIRAARQQNPPVPAILMTGYGTVESAVAALKEGAADYMLKPFRLKRMHEGIAAALERNRQARADSRLASTVALYDFAATARTRWHLRPLLQQIAGRLERDLDCDAALVLLGAPGGGAWERFCPSEVSANASPELLAEVDAERLAASLVDGANLVTGAPAALFARHGEADPFPARLAARPLVVELPGASPRIAGALVAAWAQPPAPGVEEGLPSLTRWANLASATVSRVLAIDPAAGGSAGPGPGA